MLHGMKEANKAEQAAKQIFENKGSSSDMPTLTLTNKNNERDVYSYQSLLLK